MIKFSQNLYFFNMTGKLEFSQYLGLCGSSLSLLFNGVLLFLIFRFSRPEYGSYKILMILMTSLYLVYSAIEVVVLPSYFVFEYNYLLFTTNFIEYQEVCQILIVTFCAIFGVMQMVLAFQFIFRSMSVACSSHLRDRFFRGKRHSIWITVSFLFFLNWFLVALFVFANHGDHPKELEVAVAKRFDRNISEMAFTLVTYAQLDKNELVHVKWLDICMIFYLLGCAAVPMLISLICGLKTWHEIHITANMIQKSYRLQKQERQLFAALLIQFTVPFLGNTIPMMILFLCPALHISPEPYTNYICILIPFYPIFDASATVYIIKDYYRGMLKMLGLSDYIHYNSSSNFGNDPPPNTVQVTQSSNQPLFEVRRGNEAIQMVEL